MTLVIIGLGVLLIASGVLLSFLNDRRFRTSDQNHDERFR